MKKFILKTHGCKSNQLESYVIKEKLINAGYIETSSFFDADIFVLNSCSVTENADVDALRVLRNAKNKKNDLITVLTGCSAQLNAEDLKSCDFVDLVLGNDDKFHIVERLHDRTSVVTDIFSVNEFNYQPIYSYNNTRGYLKIQDGCNNYCSYCTIINARGNSRSNSVENIVEQINIFARSGIKEVVLTGIHIGQWGLDFSEKKSLLNLLEAIEKTDIVRYRLGSLNILELTDELLNFLAQSDKFCQHFHLSLQSLNDKVLKSMNRHYTADSCLVLMEKIATLFNGKNPFIGSDVIVGFPGETNDDFTCTLENIRKSKLSNIHVFPYSVRSNTKAASMPNQVDDNIKQERSVLLHSIAKDKYDAFIAQNIGVNAEVLIEKRPDKHTGLLKGVTRNYLTVLLNSDDTTLYNSIRQVKISGFNETYGKLEGVLLGEDENINCSK